MNISFEPTNLDSEIKRLLEKQHSDALDLFLMFILSTEASVSREDLLHLTFLRLIPTSTLSKFEIRCLEKYDIVLEIEFELNERDSICSTEKAIIRIGKGGNQ